MRRTRMPISASLLRLENALGTTSPEPSRFRSSEERSPYSQTPYGKTKNPNDEDIPVTRSYHHHGHIQRLLLRGGLDSTSVAVTYKFGHYFPS